MEVIKRGIDRYKTTGDLTEEFFTLLATFNKKSVEELKKMPHEEAIAFMKKRYNYLYDNFVSEQNKTKYGLKKFEEVGIPTKNWRQYR